MTAADQNPVDPAARTTDVGPPTGAEADPHDFSELEGGGVSALDGTSLPPAAAKVSPATPELQIAGAGRHLRKRAIAIAVTCAITVAGLSLLFAGKGQATQPRRREEPVATAPVPQALLDAPETALKPAVPLAGTPERDARPSVPARQPPAADPGHRAADLRKTKAEEELSKARSGAILVDTGLPTTVAHAAAPHDGLGDELPERGRGRELQRGGAAPGGGDIFGDDPNLQGRKNQFLSGELAPSARRRGPRIQHSQSPFELKPGEIIPAALETAVSSDLPGPVIARVTENVCDRYGNWLLIPQGSTLIAYYDSMIAWGQERVLMCWAQLVLPNGDEIPLGCMPAADWAGQAGLSDQVDEHWSRIVKGAAVSTLLTTGTAMAGGNTMGFNPTLPQLAARGAATEIGSVGQAITRRNIMIQPTLTIRQAQPVNVIITETLDFFSGQGATPCDSRQE